MSDTCTATYFQVPEPPTLPPVQDQAGINAPSPRKPRHFYLSVRAKFAIALATSVLWAIAASLMAQRWVDELSEVCGQTLAHLIIYGIAVIPGFMNAFLVVSLLLDHRPRFRQQTLQQPLPPITILVAAYNESSSILGTLESLEKQNYPGQMRVIVINDGSTDNTLDLLRSVHYPWLQVLDMGHNVGKARALTHALSLVNTKLTLTVDGDSYLYKNALANIVRRYLSDPVNTRAVAGAVLVRNSRKNLVTRIQEWDYFHGIAAIKRLQSLYQGTLVAQGAFSLYDTKTLCELGGWPHTVGEDIVLTWSILKAGHRVGFAENACLFTNAPDTWTQFIRQRQRWSRGLIEAFKEHWQLLFKPRMSTLFIWWNLLFPYMDLVYTFAFVPGLVLGAVEI